MIKKATINALEDLYEKSPSIEISKKDRWVIFSDLHMGNGGSNDDFTSNAALFLHAIKDHYLQKEYNLVLNGDVEELQRFDYHQIRDTWKEVYHTFDQFYLQKRLFKIVGNHDIGLLSQEIKDYPYPTFNSIKLIYKDNPLLIFHGHQATHSYSLQNALIGYTLRYLANPLGIKNYTVSHSSRKQYKIERNVYQFSSQKKVLSIIGHTHRPLFESLPKSVRIKFRIEQLCRDYNLKNEDESRQIKRLINIYKNELEKISDNGEAQDERENIYDSIIHLPVLFNSGCVIGKRGMTCIEINNGKIRLVHWFDKKISKKYLTHTGYRPEQSDNSDYFRMLLNKEKLNYIFARINLLA